MNIHLPVPNLVAILVLLAFTNANAALVTPVANAAQQGDIAMVRQLLRQGSDVNESQGDGMTALHWAAERGDFELAEILIFAGANIGAGTRIGVYTPLHIASRNGNAAVMKALIEANADINAMTTNSGVMPIHLAAASARLESVKVLLEAGANPNSQEQAWGQIPLMFAASANRADNIQILLQAGADPSISSQVIDVVEREKADKYAEDRLVEVLAEFKAKEAGDAKWIPKASQVQAAIDYSREIQRNWPKVKAALCNQPTQSETGPVLDEATKKICTPSAKTESDKVKTATERPSYGQLVGSWGGLTPLLHAVRQGNTKATVALLNGGADINQTSAGDHTSPLLMATTNGQFDLALMLIKKGANPNLTSDAGASPLFAVLERQWAPWANYAHPVDYQQQKATHLDVLQTLLDAGANPNLHLNKHLWYSEFVISVLSSAGMHYAGATPFWRAAFALDVDAMRMLKTYGANTSAPTLKIPERKRRRRGPDAKIKESKQVVTEGRALAAAKEAVGIGPVQEGQSGSEKDPSGLPPVPIGGPFIFPIHAAAGAGYGQSYAGNAHRHAPDNWLSAVRFLVEECGADVNIRDGNGYTPLHHAASRGDNEMIKYLVDHGADILVVSRKGQTTVDMANGPIQRVSPFPDTIELLVSLGALNNDNCVSC